MEETKARRNAYPVEFHARFPGRRRRGPDDPPTPDENRPAAVLPVGQPPAVTIERGPPACHRP